MLEFISALLAAERRKIFLLQLVGSKLSKSLVESLRWLAEDVEVLDQGLVDSASLQG